MGSEKQWSRVCETRVGKNRLTSNRNSKASTACASKLRQLLSFSKPSAYVYAAKIHIRLCIRLCIRRPPGFPIFRQLRHFRLQKELELSKFHFLPVSSIYLFFFTRHRMEVAFFEIHGSKIICRYLQVKRKIFGLSPSVR